MDAEKSLETFIRAGQFESKAENTPLFLIPSTERTLHEKDAHRHYRIRERGPGTSGLRCQSHATFITSIQSDRVKYAGQQDVTLTGQQGDSGRSCQSKRDARASRRDDTSG